MCVTTPKTAGDVRGNVEPEVGGMRIGRLFLVFPFALAAQLPPSAALVRGVLVERDAQATSGEFSVRAEGNQVFRYRFDPKTYVEREQRISAIARLVPGDKVEVVSDEGPGSTLRYARTVHVFETPPPQRPLSQGRVRAYRTPADRLAPISTLSFAGVVSRLNSDRVVLHTRDAGDQTILLRQDTRYLQDGTMVEPADLKPNMRVFVRAGRNLYNEVEAYQVIWGTILMPR
jgi:hypothetical protein